MRTPPSIFSNIGGQQATSSAAPALSSSENSLGYATLNTENWASTLRLALIDNTGKVRRDANNKPIYQSVDFPALAPNGTARRVMLTTNDTALYFDNNSSFSSQYSNPNTRNTMLSLTPTSGSANAWRDAYMPWVIKTSNSTDANINISGNSSFGLGFRDRLTQTSVPDERFMGDIIGSSIMAMGPRLSQIGDKEKYLITAANDGMFYLFRSKLNNASNIANTDASFKPYELKLNYIPGAFSRERSDGTAETLLQGMRDVSMPGYGTSLTQQHKFLINGGMVYMRTDKGINNGQQLVVAGSMGQGARGAYAFNVGGQLRSSGADIALEHDDQSRWLKEVPLWETNNNNIGKAKAGSANLGYVVGEGPALARIAKSRVMGSDGVTLNPNKVNNVVYATLVPNGIDDAVSAFRADNTPTLNVYDTLGQEVGTGGASFDANNVGKLIKAIPVDNGWNNGATVQGLSAPVSIDTNFDGITDLAYAGDMDGNIYRFDMRALDPNGWTGKRIYKGNASQPIIAKPTVYQVKPNQLIVYVGTGKDVLATDMNDTSLQSFLAIYDDISQVPAPVTKSDLLQQQFGTSWDASGVQVRQATTNPAPTTGMKGWYINLTEGASQVGERVTTQAIVRGNNIIFSTRIYQQDTSQANLVCSSTSAAGRGYINSLDLKSGAGAVYGKGSYFSTVTKTNVFSSIGTLGIASTPSGSTIQGSYITDPSGVLSSGEFHAIDETINYKGKVCNKSTDNLYATESSGNIKEIQQTNHCTDEGAVVKRLSWREIF